jgi:hypothetical protein
MGASSSDIKMKESILIVVGRPDSTHESCRLQVLSGGKVVSNQRFELIVRNLKKSHLILIARSGFLTSFALARTKQQSAVGVRGRLYFMLFFFQTF